MEQNAIEELRKQIERFEYELSIQFDKAADKAADKAVYEVFSRLGVDVDSPTDMQRFRDDLRFGGVFRSAASKGLMAMVAAVFGGLGLSVWLAIKDHIGLK